jgi:lysine-specific demethylase 8
MADAAWALFGDDDDDDVAASDEKAPPPPRASAHPFFVATRDCWCPEPMDDARSPSMSREAARASLNLEGRVPALAASLRGRDMREPADALSGMLETPSARRASDVVAASVRALASDSSVDDIDASRLNAAILLARAVQADRALDAANEAMPSDVGDDGRSIRLKLDFAAASLARRLAMAAAEAAVLLAECALLVDDPSDDSCRTRKGTKEGGDESSSRRWIGARVAAASAAAARAERAYLRVVAGSRTRENENENENESERERVRLRPLSSAMDEHVRSVVSDLRRAAESKGTTHWGDADRVDARSSSVRTAASFYNAFVRENRPAVLRGVLARDAWRAPETFRDLHWLRETYGDTPVPVEVGSFTPGRGYVSAGNDENDDEDTSRDAFAESVAEARKPRYATLRRFLESYFAETAADAKESVAYVSQHSLLHQLPGLQDHFAVPDLCLGRLRAANAWLGTANTTTHLHTDDAENLLCQVAGHKLVRLFPPSCGATVYAEKKKAGNGSVNAFSPVDCERVDDAAFPAFAEAQKRGTQVVLGPGETLFIPRGWWHYARALEPSFSVNFWF